MGHFFLDRLICRSLDTEHLPKSLDSEVEHRESLAQTEEYERGSLELEVDEHCTGVEEMICFVQAVVFLVCSRFVHVSGDQSCIYLVRYPRSGQPAGGCSKFLPFFCLVRFWKTVVDVVICRCLGEEHFSRFCKMRMFFV